MKRVISSVFAVFTVLGSIGLAEAQIPRDHDAGELMRVCMAQARGDCNDWVNQIRGGELPRGISINTFVELADGEKYYLDGKVALSGSQAYFAVDLTRHAWLGSSLRKAFPFYRLEGDVSRWKKWDQSPVELLVQAKSVMPSGRTRPEIVLTGLQEPSPRNLLPDAGCKTPGVGH